MKYTLLNLTAERNAAINYLQNHSFKMAKN